MMDRESLRHWHGQPSELGPPAITSYGEAAASVLVGAEAALVHTVTCAAVKALKRTGCICGGVEATVLGGLYRTVPVRDPRCGMHDEVSR